MRRTSSFGPARRRFKRPTADEQAIIKDRQREELEAESRHLMDLILEQPPKDLLGYIWARPLIAQMGMEDAGQRQAAKDTIGTMQFVLEYMHAAWATSKDESGERLDEATVAEIWKIAERLRMKALLFAMATSESPENAVFGKLGPQIEFHAKSDWILIRGSRYQVLENEFFALALAPHDEALREIYGIGAEELSSGIQAISDSMRSGHVDAIEALQSMMDLTTQVMRDRGLSMKDATKALKSEGGLADKDAVGVFSDMFRGGICNLSVHTNLPAKLLSDMSFERGEDVAFLAEGDLRGTPLRSLPARTKPLIHLDDGYYAVDPAFVRDTAYRLIQRNLLRHKPSYAEEWNAKQKDFSEGAFANILERQLVGAKIFKEVWYRDPLTHQWVENDIVAILDDVLISVEAKGGAAASVASPADDLPRHVRSIQDLVVKAYDQCRRFIEYVASAPEVPIYRRNNGRYEEVHRICLSDYRMVLPIGLTIESFSPYSTICKELDEVAPILGKYPFISLAIDELLVLTRFLPKAGVLFHYLQVRQAVAGMKGARLFDEFDHLGAYLAKNRFDLIIETQLAKKVNLVAWDGFSEKVDEYFAQPDWDKEQPPTQEMPPIAENLLDALDRTASEGRLRVDAHIRDLGKEGREDLAGMLQKTIDGLDKRPWRYFQLGLKPPLFVWIHLSALPFDEVLACRKAAAAAIAMSSRTVVAIAVSVGADKVISGASPFQVEIPPPGSARFEELAQEAGAARDRFLPIAGVKPEVPLKLGRNDPCWCGSGEKYKRCHGGD